MEKNVQSEIRKNQETFQAKWKRLIEIQVDLLKHPTRQLDRSSIIQNFAVGL